MHYDHFLCAKKGKKILASLLCLAFFISPFAILNAWGAVDMPVVTDGASVTYFNRGLSAILSPTDVFITPSEETTYYFDFYGASVDVYYDGETGLPIGSYFDGSLVKGAFVTTLEAPLDKTTGTLVPSDSGKITVPKPETGNPVTLRIVAYKDNKASDIYSHTFALDPAIPAPVITDGDSFVYVNNGVTEVAEAIDVFISPEDEVTYYYLFVHEVTSVDVRYEGENGSPVGSYFDGSLENGALVTTLGVTPGRGSGQPVTAADNWRISIPYPPTDLPIVLKVVGYKGDEASLVYTHSFTRKKAIKVFDATLIGDVIAATYENDTSDEVKGVIYAAVYNEKGALSAVRAAQFVNSGTLSFSVSEYPPEEGYSYTVFLWNDSNIPMSNPIPLSRGR
jgi:hypothetical protein